MGKLTTDNELYVRTGLFRALAGSTFVYAVNVFDHSLRRSIDLYIIPAVARPSADYRIMLYGALDAPVARGFALRVQADATREGVIVAGTKHDDLVVTFGVSYRNEWSSKP